MYARGIPTRRFRYYNILHYLHATSPAPRSLGPSVLLFVYCSRGHCRGEQVGRRQGGRKKKKNNKLCIIKIVYRIVYARTHARTTHRIRSGGPLQPRCVTAPSSSSSSPVYLKTVCAAPSSFLNRLRPREEHSVVVRVYNITYVFSSYITRYMRALPSAPPARRARTISVERKKKKYHMST